MAVTEFTEETFFDLTGQNVSTFSFLRLFNILLDEDRETKFLNIFRAFQVNDDVFNNVQFFNTYNVANGEHWDNVSFSIYETPFLWWIVAITNNIVNPFEDLDNGDILNVLREEYIYTLTKDLEKVADSAT